MYLTMTLCVSGLSLCGYDLLLLYVCGVYHPIRPLLSDWDFGVCVHVSRFLGCRQLRSSLAVCV